MKRLLEDPRYGGELRADLLRSRSAGQDYQTAAKLLQLRTAFSDNAPAAPDTGLSATLARSVHPGWKLAVLGALGGGVGLFAYSMADTAQRDALALQPRVTIEAPTVDANEQPPVVADAPPPSAANAALPLPAANAAPPTAAANAATPTAAANADTPTAAANADTPTAAANADTPTAAANAATPTAAANAATPTAAANVAPPRDAANLVLPPAASRVRGAGRIVRVGPSFEAAQPAATPVSDGGSSRREIAQLVRMRALLEREPAAAYRLAQRGEREFPRGILAQERQALAIVALARTGATEQAHTQARRFFARYPQSPLRESIETALRR